MKCPGARRLRLALYFGLLFIFCFGCQSTIEPNWSQPVVIETPQLTVVSQSSQFAADRAVKVYQTLLKDVRDSKLQPLLQNLPQVKLYLFDSSKEFLEFAPHQHGHGSLQGYYLESACLAFTVAKEKWPTKPWYVLRHEFAHHIHHGPGRRAPWWLAEGIAHYLENGEDLSAPGFVTQLQPALIKLSTVPMTEECLQQLSQTANGEGDSTLLRFIAYLFVHFILNDRPDPFIHWLVTRADDIDDSTQVPALIRQLGYQSGEFAKAFCDHARRFCREHLRKLWCQELLMLYHALSSINQDLERISQQLKANNESAEQVLAVFLKTGSHKHSREAVEFAQKLQNKILITSHIESMALKPRLPK